MAKNKFDNTITSGLITALKKALTIVEKEDIAYNPEQVLYDELRDTSYVFDDAYKVLNDINIVVRRMKIRRKEELNKRPAPVKSESSNNKDVDISAYTEEEKDALINLIIASRSSEDVNPE